MKRIVFYSVEPMGGDVSVCGEFRVLRGDSVALLGSSLTPIHAWKNKKDSCRDLGFDCPITLMQGLPIQDKPDALGSYSLGPKAPDGHSGTTGTNGTLNVGSFPGDDGGKD